ncbi:MAG: hypothetical protein PHQ09_03460 [Actinomycetota bacterium]|nr:hypothetical protein [Actinomycetota bacterium]
MYKCPHCGKKGISVWGKLTIGMYNPAICKECGNEVRVPYTSALILSIFTVGFITVLSFVDSIILKIVISVVMASLSLFLYLKYVPLIPEYK